MDYMTLKEAAEKWGVTPRRINYYCDGGCVSGGVQMVIIWLIFMYAEKPTDRRFKNTKISSHEISVTFGCYTKNEGV